GAMAYEEHSLGACRIGRGRDRGPSGIRARPRRQAVDDVSVVGRRLLFLALRDRMAERALAADEAVDNGRIGFESPLLLEPVDKHCSNPRPLLGLAGFFLDDR